MHSRKGSKRTGSMPAEGKRRLSRAEGAVCGCVWPDPDDCNPSGRTDDLLRVLRLEAAGPPAAEVLRPLVRLQHAR